MKTIINFLLKTVKWLLSGLLKGLKWIWRKYPEIFSVPAAFVIWWLSASFLRWLDPTSAVFDAGVLQIPLYAILLSFLFLSIAWMIMGMLFGTGRNFLKKDLKNAFNSITPWSKIKYSTGIFFLLYFSLVFLSYILSTAPVKGF